MVHFFREARNAVFDIRGYDTRNPRTGETVRTPGVAERLEAVEKELKPNGGGSLRDRIDQVHVLATDNNEKHARIEDQLKTQARLTADAARVAAKNDDEIAKIRAETRRRHQENLARFDALEQQDENAKILRELLLITLRDKHGIDLMPDEDDSPDDAA